MIKSRWPWSAAWLVLWLVGACGSGSGNQPVDAEVVDARRIDATLIDAVAIDAPLSDAMADAAGDAAVLDAVALDATVLDAAVLDAAVLDAPVPPDATPDAPTPPDAQVADAPIPPDAQVADAPIPPDAQVADAPLPPDAAVPPADAPSIPPDAPPAPGPTRLRLVAGNITSGNGQAYEPPGIRIFRGLAPDIAMIQEFNFKSSTPGDLRSFVDQAFGPAFNFTRGAAVQQIPNGVVSRYPILDSGEWVDPEVSNRAFTWARLDIPGPIDLVAISVHLLTANASTRNAEAIELVRNMQTLPGNPYIVLGGDFNTDTRTEPALSTLSSVVVTAGPHPADQAANGNTNAGRAKPYDWVLANPALDALETPTTIGANQFANGLVVDTRVYQPIADLAPAVASDSAANMMQHMAVVRDFLIPGGAPPVASLHVTSPNGGEVWQVGTNRTITWESSGVANVRVELITGSIVWTVATSIPAVNGEVSLTVPPAVTTEAVARITEVGGTLTDSSDAPFSITMTPPPTGRAFLNEVLANEPGTDVTGEFIELVNSGASDVDVSGWTLADSAQVRHTFPAGSLLRAGRAIVVFGGIASIPAGLANAVPASSGALGLSNSGDSVTLRSPSAIIDSMTFTAAEALDGISVNRNPDGDATGTFVLHNTLAATPISPGVRTTGAAF